MNNFIRKFVHFDYFYLQPRSFDLLHFPSDVEIPGYKSPPEMCYVYANVVLFGEKGLRLRPRICTSRPHLSSLSASFRKPGGYISQTHFPRLPQSSLSESFSFYRFSLYLSFCSPYQTFYTCFQKT